MNADHARGSPMTLCLLYLEQAAVEAGRASTNPQRWFFAVPEIHRALNCALVAALSGSAGIGAFSQKVRHRWIAHFNQPDWPDLPRPRDGWVETFPVLLARSLDADEPEMHGRPIVLTDAQQEDLSLLTEFRNDMEHVKPGGWSIEAASLPRLLAAAAEAIHQLLQQPRCLTEWEEEDEERADRAIALIRALANL